MSADRDGAETVRQRIKRAEVMALGQNSVLSKKEEKGFLELGRQVFLNDFPNPERKGCPESKVIQEIAAGSLPAGEANEWTLHFTSCSPCSREFSEFRRRLQRPKRVTVASISALCIAAVCAAVWVATSRRANVKPGENIATSSRAGMYPQEVLDLRNWSAVRSDQAAGPKGQKPLELQRARASLVIYLPMGSQPGKYEARITSKSNQLALNVSGVARIENGNTVLRVRTDLSKLIPGQYSLGIRQPPWDWRSYPFALR